MSGVWGPILVVGWAIVGGYVAYLLAKWLGL
jgi:hypothetical protein